MKNVNYMNYMIERRKSHVELLCEHVASLVDLRLACSSFFTLYYDYIYKKRKKNRKVLRSYNFKSLFIPLG